MATVQQVLGKADCHRIGRWAFPAYELTQNGEAVALMGRSGWFRIFFGTGQKVQLADGDRWLVRSVGIAGAIWAAVVDSDGRKVAIAGETNGTYGINTRDQAWVFYPAGVRGVGRKKWVLRSFEDDVAVVHRTPLSIETSRPVPLGVVLLCFVIARYGIPGSALNLPAFRWR